MSERPIKLIIRPPTLRLFAISALWMLMVAVLLPALRAFTVRPPSFENLVADADQILRVEVTASSSRQDDGAASGEKVIHTYVECRVLRTLKGAETPSITLRFFGGRTAEAEMHVPDMPRLEVGSHYLVFLRRNGQAFCPLLGVMYGGYQIQTDTATGAERVLRGNGEPLLHTQDVSRPMGAAVPRAASVSAEAMTREQFETLIVSQLARIAPK